MGGFGDLIDAVVVGEEDYTVRELAQKLSGVDMHRVQEIFFSCDTATFGLLVFITVIIYNDFLVGIRQSP